MAEFMEEIDGVRLELERAAWESGDYISDEYWTVIDYTTARDRLSHASVQRIARGIGRLNCNIDTTSVLLVGTEMAQVYDDVVTQINEINSDIADKVGLLSILNYEDTRYEGASGSFKWAA